MGNNFRKNIEAFRLRILIICISFLCFSCGQESKTKSNNKKDSEYYLEKVDSIRIDRENRVRLLDFDPNSKRFLAYDQITQEFLVLDQGGQVLETIYRVGEGPNEYNSSLIAASFNHEAGGFFALSSREFLWFNENWEVEKRTRFASQMQIVSYDGPSIKVPYYTLPGASDPYIYTNFFQGIYPGVGGDQDGVTSKYLIEQYNPQKGVLEWVLSHDPLLLPNFELDEDNKQFKPVQVYALDNETKVMFLTFERSQEIGVYDLEKGFELKEKIRFDQENFTQSNKSKNTSLFYFSPGIFGVLYFRGLSEAATNARKATDPQYFPYSDASLYRLVIVQDGLQQENEIGFPLNCEPHSEIIQLPNNRILLRDRYIGDDEPEYSTYSIFELKSQ